MHRERNIFARIPDWENLRQAVARALRGKRNKADAREFTSNLDANLSRLRQQMITHTVVLGRMHQFTIHDPKERLITAPSVEERVLHHAIMNICEPVLDRVMVFDTYACRLGKGREACLRRAQAFSHRHGWFLKLDVRKYFDSVNHGALLHLLTKRFKDSALLELFDRIVASYQVTQGHGLPIGSLTSQHFANFYLNSLDRLIKEHLHVPGYVRYMDDMVLWGDSRQILQEWYGRIQGFAEQHLQLDFKLPQINRTRHGIDLLGCRVFATHRILNQRSRCRFRRKLKALDASFAADEFDEAKLQQRAQALLAFSRSGDTKSWQFRRTVLSNTAR